MEEVDDGQFHDARLDTGRVKLLTRRGNDWTDKFQSVADALKELEVNQALLDGEIVILKENGASSFEAMQQALSAGDEAGSPSRKFSASSFRAPSATRNALISSAPMSSTVLLMKSCRVCDTACTKPMYCAVCSM